MVEICNQGMPLKTTPWCDRFHPALGITGALAMVILTPKVPWFLYDIPTVGLLDKLHRDILINSYHGISRILDFVHAQNNTASNPIYGLCPRASERRFLKNMGWIGIFIVHIFTSYTFTFCTIFHLHISPLHILHLHILHLHTFCLNILHCPIIYLHICTAYIFTFCICTSYTCTSAQLTPSHFTPAHIAYALSLSVSSRDTRGRVSK